MKDRVPTKPNRYAVYDDSHNFIRYEYHERADEPTQEGTPLNKATLLSDAVAALYGLGAAAVPDDVLSFIKPTLDAKAKAVFGSFTTNAAGIATVNLAVQPIAVLIYSENNNWTTIPTGSTGGNVSQMIKILTRAFVATGTDVNAITATGFTFSGTTARSVCRYVALI